MRVPAFLLCLAAVTAAACEPNRAPAAISAHAAPGAFKATISSGERVALAAHALGDGRTIFEFTADW